MKIGFDAKRAFHNYTGLGNYSRTLISSLASLYPENQYLVFNPKKTSYKPFHFKSVEEINPQNIIEQIIPFLWRDFSMPKDFPKDLDIFHGLSNELPLRIHHAKIKKIVTVHDILYLHFPNDFTSFDRRRYEKKMLYALQYADKIIATSLKTKKDLIEYYQIPENKIDVVYQSCNSIFQAKIDSSQQDFFEKKLLLPKRYFLSVGSIIERKNLANTILAFKKLKTQKKSQDIKLIIIGNGNQYKSQIKTLISKQQLENEIIWLNETIDSQLIEKGLPYIYSNAAALLYPSFYEGFGIPVLEAMACNCPVITSYNTSMAEICENYALFVNPHDENDIAKQMQRAIEDTNFIETMTIQANKRTALFSKENIAKQIFELYQSLLTP
ncbi:MAG: glycosyltransferase family 1 protein [Chitinophagaceae bacterium]